jgi:hypothetical protein
MMTSPQPQAAQAPMVVQSSPPPVIVEEHYYDPFYSPSVHYYHGPRYRYCGPPGPRMSWGVSVMR